MRIDHLAYRTADRKKTAQFFIDAFGYQIQTEFTIYFNDEKTETADCIALEPPEKVDKEMPFSYAFLPENATEAHVYHLAPEIFVSSSDTPGSIVYEWVAKRGGVGGIHHL